MAKKEKKEITNSELLGSINRSFSRVEERLVTMATKEDLRKTEFKLEYFTDARSGHK